jgi:hypothetical protein
MDSLKSAALVIERRHTYFVVKRIFLHAVSTPVLVLSLVAISMQVSLSFLNYAYRFCIQYFKFELRTERARSDQALDADLLPTFSPIVQT